VPIGHWVAEDDLSAVEIRTIANSTFPLRNHLVLFFSKESNVRPIASNQFLTLHLKGGSDC
jgi:hypothetical protein